MHFKIPNVVLLVPVSLLLIIVVGVVAHKWWLARSYPGPDLVSLVRSGVLSEDQVASIHILKFEIPGSWPFSESDYDRKARKRLGADEASRLLRILGEESVPRRRHNHPQTVYMGIFRVDLKNGDHHYVIYSLMFCEGEYFVSVDSNAANCANPNRATDLENVFSLRSFLQSHDPWYHTADEPFEARQNSPDTAP